MHRTWAQPYVGHAMRRVGVQAGPAQQHITAACYISVVFTAAKDMALAHFLSCTDADHVIPGPCTSLLRLVQTRASAGMHTTSFGDALLAVQQPLLPLEHLPSVEDTEDTVDMRAIALDLMGTSADSLGSFYQERTYRTRWDIGGYYRTARTSGLSGHWMDTMAIEMHI